MGSNQTVELPQGVQELMSQTHNGSRVSRLWALPLPMTAGDADLDRPHLHFKVPATAAQLTILRPCVRTWTKDIGMSRDMAGDVVLAVDEALANAVEHAYAETTSGAVVLFAACDRYSGSARVIISDSGRWRPPPADPGTRGRGLPIMRQLSSAFSLRHDEAGTTVVLEWPVSP
ncbi:anti-sigma regulatory factor (Ser/Thr protein kinase) [Kibdelosporangium banguiense]|uniref:Anti-sigma regulatory factor (Ser/Thr protein kinase) n=1 Tax=Kibdelosporangium banguiense TaxID=1365924 RepID=A0ABS4TPQ2_9PSEU|nr:ATP-binding protein [Kibdelosporangium banguiense]MBP2326382.1 anti-sigma regulatory factor (Ser/Thr protein kinase) [Kibdelosporangium banguiense]